MSFFLLAFILKRCPAEVLLLFSQLFSGPSSFCRFLFSRCSSARCFLPSSLHPAVGPHLCAAAAVRYRVPVRGRMVLSTSQQVALAFTAVLFTFVVLPRLFGVGGGAGAKETRFDPRYSRKGGTLFTVVFEGITADCCLRHITAPAE